MKSTVTVSIEKGILAVNVISEYQLLEEFLLGLLMFLKQEYTLSYQCVGTDLSAFLSHFAGRDINYKPNDTDKIFMKKLPELIVRDISSKDVQFISNNWKVTSIVQTLLSRRHLYLKSACVA